MRGPSDPSIAALTIGLALIAGMMAQVLARRLRVPGIVVLLATGVLLGPELLNIVQPESLGPGLHTLIGFAVAVILFEGSMSLDLRRLRSQARVIQLLVTVGAVITAAGATLAARAFLGWPWPVALLFGTLVMVTGPTVINPLLQRIRVTRPAHNVLEAEGIFVDAIGAMAAVVTLEIVLGPSAEVLSTGVEGLGARVAAGVGVGAVTGLLVATALRKPGRIPEGLENVFSLSMALGAFQISEALAHESGVLAAIVAGLWVGNAQVPMKKSVLLFKEQLTVLLLGLLFVLLAANVRLDHVIALGTGGVITVALLMFVIRPIAVFVSAWKSDLTVRERAFVAWLGPRGIVAAAIASLFEQRLVGAGMSEGTELRALVFLVIATTVCVQGLSGGQVARLLGVRRQGPRGYVILGAQGLARQVASALRDAGREILLVELDPQPTRRAEEEGFRVLFANGLEERTLLRTEPESRQGYIGLTHNEAVNLLFAQRAASVKRKATIHVALHRGHVGVGATDVVAMGGRILFGDERMLDAWSARADRDELMQEQWQLSAPQVASAVPSATGPLEEVLLPVLRLRNDAVDVFDDACALVAEDRVVFFVNTARQQEAHTWLQAHGWVRVSEGPAERRIPA